MRALRIGPAWGGRGYCVVVGLAASEFRLEAGTFLLLGNHPSFLLLADSELLLMPSLELEVVVFLSQIATIWALSCIGRSTT